VRKVCSFDFPLESTYAPVVTTTTTAAKIDKDFDVLPDVVIAPNEDLQNVRFLGIPN